MSKRNSISKVQRAWRKREHYSGLAARWTKEAEERELAHRTDHPLSNEDRQKIHDLYLAGKPLCCERGKKNLKAVLDDPVWAGFINDQAYERLGCDPMWRPSGSQFEDGKKVLDEILEGKE